MIITCQICQKEFKVSAARKDTAKFCSVKCKAVFQHLYIHGANHPRWTEAQRVKVCQECGIEFVQKPTEAISTFQKRKFCGNKCGWIGQNYYAGENHPNWTGGIRLRDFRHTKWRETVLRRDNGICQKCGVTGIELHAHHIKSFIDYEESRYDVNNGITLCCVCHWDEHSAFIENGVNSGDILPSHVGDNPEPSLSRKAFEGATTNSRAYRRLETSCALCGNYISRQLSQVKGKTFLFCDKVCMGKHYSLYSSNRRYGSNANTSAPPVKG